MTEVDEECVLLIVNSSLLPRLTSSRLYPYLVIKITQMDSPVPQLAAEQLEEAGHPVHAATIQVELKPLLTILTLLTQFSRCHLMEFLLV